MIVIIHELNHYVRRYNRFNTKIDDCATGRSKSDEGGELMFKEIFGVRYMDCLDFKIEKEVTNIDKWNGNDMKYFTQFFSSDYVPSQCIQFMRTKRKFLSCVEHPDPVIKK